MKRIKVYGKKHIIGYGRLNLVGWDDVKSLPVEYEETDAEYGLDVYSLNVVGRETVWFCIDPEHDNRYE